MQTLRGGQAHLPKHTHAHTPPGTRTCAPAGNTTPFASPTIVVGTGSTAGRRKLQQTTPVPVDPAIAAAQGVTATPGAFSGPGMAPPVNVGTGTVNAPSPIGTGTVNAPVVMPTTPANNVGVTPTNIQDQVGPGWRLACCLRAACKAARRGPWLLGPSRVFCMAQYGWLVSAAALPPPPQPPAAAHPLPPLPPPCSVRMCPTAGPLQTVRPPCPVWWPAPCPAAASARA